MRILFIEDEERDYDTAKLAAECACKNNSAELKPQWFQKLEDLEEMGDQIGHEYDLMILDLKLSNATNSEKETIKVLLDIAQRQFIPVVIYSGYTTDISNNSPLNEGLGLYQFSVLFALPLSGSYRTLLSYSQLPSCQFLSPVCS